MARTIEIDITSDRVRTYRVVFLRHAAGFMSLRIGVPDVTDGEDGEVQCLALTRLRKPIIETQYSTVGAFSCIHLRRHRNKCEMEQMPTQLRWLEISKTERAMNNIIYIVGLVVIVVVVLGYFGLR